MLSEMALKNPANAQNNEIINIQILAFDFFDKDKSGKLSPEEIKSVLGVHESENIDIIKNIISEVDINNDGLISFEEFKHLMQNVVKDKNI